MAKTDSRGFYIDSKGRAVHPDMVRVDEKTKDELVERLANKAREVSEGIRAFRKSAEEEIEAYFEMLLVDYGVDKKATTKKGNLTLENYSGTAKVQLSITERIRFDEKLQIAKMKLDDYLNELTEHSNPIIRTLITGAFDVDKEGNIDAKKIFALRRFDVQAQPWKEAMAIIDESKKVVSSKGYIRFYEADGNGGYRLIPIDLAAV